MNIGLYARANQVVERAAPELENDPNRQEAVEEVVGRLRERHECNHVAWTLRRGAAQCEECRHTLPAFTYMCDGCHMRACVRCRRHRLR